MLKTILFFVLCSVQLSHGLESSHHYNFPKMIENIGSHVGANQMLKNIDLNVFSILFEFKNLIRDFDKVLKNALNEMDTTTKCNRDIKYLADNLNGTDAWAGKMLDAFGKPGSGILEGNFKWIGNYHECTNIHVPSNQNGTAGDFDGQYCNLDISLTVSNQTIPLILGVCLPDSCESELNEVADAMRVLNVNQSLVNVTKVICQPTKRKLTSPAIGVIFLLSVFVALALIGSGMTAYEYFFKSDLTDDSYSAYKKIDVPIIGMLDKQEYDKSFGLSPEKNLVNGLYGKLKPFFNCFCVFTNGEKLLNTDGTEGQLLCLHGIRFLSMTWVIVCHTYAFCFTSVGNLMETMTLIDGFLFQILLNGFFSVDSFFLLSGFLVAYLFFQEFSKKKGNFPWVYFYVHRYIRLTPVYMIVLGIYTTLFFYMGSGPFWTTNAVEPVCKKNWWYNLLYINNFLTVNTQCFGWAWYLANDMQFFIISPLFFITLLRWPKIGYSVIGIVLSISFAANFGITYYYDLICGLGNVSGLENDLAAFTARYNEFFDKIYIKPYTRISPYIVGIVLAYYMFKRNETTKEKINKITLYCGWVVATAVTLTCLFCLYHRTLTTVENSLYNAFNRTCFAGGLAWVIFTCLNGQGGPVNTILSFKPFIPLSRLTYCAYLVHPLYIYGYFGALKTTLHFTHITMVTTYLGLLILTYATSFVISVLFESPIIRLDKLVRTKFR